MLQSIIEFIKDVVKIRSEFYNLEKEIPLTTDDPGYDENRCRSKNLGVSIFDRYY